MNGIFGFIKSEIARGNEVRITNFGKFLMRERPPKTVRNFSADDNMRIPARIVPFFVPSDSFRYLKSKEMKDET